MMHSTTEKPSLSHPLPDCINADTPADFCLSLSDIEYLLFPPTATSDMEQLVNMITYSPSASTPSLAFSDVESPMLDLSLLGEASIPLETSIGDALTVPSGSLESQTAPLVVSKKKCANCHATKTPSWRRLSRTSALLCNACGLYERIHGRPRPWYVDAVDGRVKVKRPPTLLRPGCANCFIQHTPLWRRGPGGESLCNACGIFLKQHGRPRPTTGDTFMASSGLFMGEMKLSDLFPPLYFPAIEEDMSQYVHPDGLE